MAARLAAALPRVVILALVFLLATATLTFAARRTIVAPPSAQAPAAPKPEVLVVPDVRGQAYVFAKGILEDSGFAWRVEGRVHGYAANTVETQAPLPGTRVVDTGAPTIVLRLRRNSSYAQEGTPENAAPFHGSELRLLTPPRPATPKKPAPVRTKPAAKPKPKAGVARARPPAFAVRGAPKEPRNEISLTERARRLDAWLTANRRPTAPNVRSYLYQHSWIVTGAKFGWWHGEEALRILVRVDRRAQKLWGIGARNERLARRALAFVDARSR